MGINSTTEESDNVVSKRSSESERKTDKLHNKNINNMHCPPNIIRLIVSQRTERVGM